MSPIAIWKSLFYTPTTNIHMIVLTHKEEGSQVYYNIFLLTTIPCLKNQLQQVP
jgi:hypothetical protein